MRFTPEMEKSLDLDAKMDAMGLKGQPYIGVHVRRGDSCVKWKALFGATGCLGVEQHMSHVRLMAHRYSVWKVFVATDDPSILQQLQQGLPELSVVGVSDFSAVLYEMERTKDEWTEDRLRKGELDRSALLRATLTDLMLLARSRFLVAHFASNLSRLAYSLASAHWGGPIPFISVDGAWCYHWQMCCEVDAEGRSHMCS
ncbi:hypothetical protein T484DRAFT_1965230 [Baffinella frigidus]|nr:hypothetical protein T484DRAFT_1965230 [Cryptophyta sp. CCMP2293]